MPDPAVVRVLGADRRAGSGRALRIALIALGVGGIVAAAIAGARVLGKEDEPRFETDAARRGDLRVVVTATGTVEAMHTVQVGAEISGRVKSVAVDFNDRVTRGQVLLELDTEDLRARLLQGRAGLASAFAAIAQARATLDEARINARRMEVLAQHQSATAAQVDAARAAVARAEAALEAAGAERTVAGATLSASSTALGKAVIRSPIDGVVLARNVEPGQTVVAALQAPILFVLAEDLAHMELHVHIDEADIGRTREGQRATFTVDAYPEQRFSARIETIRNAPQTVANVVTYEAILSVPNAARMLRPGMTATATIVTDARRDVLLVPNAALRFVPPAIEQAEQRARLGGTPPHRRARVFTMRSGRPAEIEVRAGASDGRMTEIVSGEVRPGMRLLVDVARDD